MRYRVKDYTVSPSGSSVWLYFTAPQGVQLSSDPDNEIEPFIQEAIRLVIDESAGIVFCSSMQKQSYLERAKCTPATHQIRLQFAVPEGKTVSSTSAFTIEMDWGDVPSGLSGGDAAEQVKDFFHIVKEGDTVKVITEDGGEEVVVPVELATEQEVKDINDDVMGALYGYGKVTVTIHSLMRIGTQSQNSESSQNSENAQSYITQDLASVIYVDPEKTWAENGYPTLYDDEGNAIDTTTNPAAGDEVFNYQIQSES